MSNRLLFLEISSPINRRKWSAGKLIVEAFRTTGFSVLSLRDLQKAAVVPEDADNAEECLIEDLDSVTLLASKAGRKCPPDLTSVILPVSVLIYSDEDKNHLDQILTEHCNAVSYSDLEFQLPDNVRPSFNFRNMIASAIPGPSQIGGDNSAVCVELTFVSV